MRSGKLRHLVTIQQRTTTRDSVGGTPRLWADVAQVYASVEPIVGREFVAMQAAQSEISIRFRIRYRADVKANMRVVWGGRAYEIDGDPIDVSGLHRELVLMCRGAKNA